MEIIRYNGKAIHIEGVEFSGSPRLVFWDGFIEPFLENGIADVLNSVDQDCRNRSVSRKEFLSEGRALLAGPIFRTYSRMSEIDRKLRGHGSPDTVVAVDVSDKIAEMLEFLDKYIEAVIHDTKPPRKRSD